MGIANPLAANYGLTSLWIGQGPLFKHSLVMKRHERQPSQKVGKFQKGVTPKVFEVRSPYQKPVISYPWILQGHFNFLKIRPVGKADFLINPP